MTFEYYLDTRPGQCSLFSPPHDVADYAKWLAARYDAGHHKDGERTTLSGAAQTVHAIIQQPFDIQKRVVALGPHAGSLAKFIEDKALTLYQCAIEVDVIPW